MSPVQSVNYVAGPDLASDVTGRSRHVGKLPELTRCDRANVLAVHVKYPNTRAANISRSITRKQRKLC